MASFCLCVFVGDVSQRNKVEARRRREEEVRVVDSEVCEDCRMKIHVRISADVLEDICTYLHAGDVRTCGNRDVDRYLLTHMHAYAQTYRLCVVGSRECGVGFGPLAAGCWLLAVNF